MATPIEVAAGAAFELFLIGAATAVAYRVWGWFFPTPKRLVVAPFHKGVVLGRAGVEKVLEPGTYWIKPSRRLVVCDLRPTPFQLHAQELLTSDALAVRVSIAGEYRIQHPALFVTESSDSSSAYLLELKQALRTAVGELSGDGFLEGQALLLVRLKELLTPRGAQLGLELIQLDFYECFPMGRLRQALVPGKCAAG